MTKDTSPSVHFVKANEQTASKQQDDITIKGIVEPPIAFSALEYAYENSFIIGGIFDKLATAANSGMVEIKDKELEAVLRTIDYKNLFENVLVYGNFFMEKLIGGGGKLLALSPFLTNTMRFWHVGDKDAYYQIVNGRRVPFLLEEVIHLKTSSLKTKHYGESRFSKAVDQIILLAQIDQFYSNQFDRGMMNTSVFVDKGTPGANGKTSFLSDDNVAKLTQWMRDNLGGVQNSYKTSIIPTVLEKLDLTKEVDAKAFIEYRRELQESIAIALNIPTDMLTSRNANRSNSEVAFKTMIDLIVVPMQDSVIQQIKEQLRNEFGNSVEEIAFLPIEIADPEMDMKIYTEYRKSGIMTANEVRAKLWLPEHPDGNKLEVASGKSSTTSTADIAKEMEEIKKTYSALYGE